MKRRYLNRLIVAVLVVMLTAATAFAGTGSGGKATDQAAGDAAAKLQKELAQSHQEGSQEAKQKKAWDNAEKNLSDQAAVVEAAQKKYDTVLEMKNTGSLGFFEHEGSTSAANVIKYRVNNQDNDDTWGKTNVGAEGDATSLENMLATLDFIDEGNALRASDDHNSGVNKEPLKVTDRMMAIAQVQANASATKVGHSQMYSVGENLAWGYSDPYYGWYTREKADYEAGNYSNVGHYLNIANPENSVNRRYKTTGFAINDTGWITHGQTFSFSKSSETEYTVDEYRTRLNNYCTAIEKELDEAKTALDEAKAYQDELIANGGISNAEKKAIEKNRTKAEGDFIRLNSPASGATAFLGETLEAEYEVYDTWEYYYTTATTAVYDSNGKLISVVSGDIADANKWMSQKGSMTLDPAKYPTGTYELLIFNVPCYSNGAPVDGWETWENVPHAEATFTVECKHQWGKEYTVDKAATCTEAGKKSIHCSLCDATKDEKVIPALGHDWGEPEWTWKYDYSGASAKFTCKNDKDKSHEKTVNAVVTSTVDESEKTVYTATVAFEGKEYKDIKEKMPLPDDTRIYGDSRYDTALTVADKYKGNGKLKNVVVAYGKNFPDALAGGYLAKVKDAPILLVEPKEEDNIVNYIDSNIEAGGTVYLLGGTGVVSSSFESKLKAKGINTKRLGGKDRYETNLTILREAGVSDQDILVCTSTGYADSLSASAAGLPILLVSNNLSGAQKTYLKTLGTGKFYLIGGTGAVKPTIEADLRGLGYNSIERLSGSTRYETSTAVAKKFFPNTNTVILAYAQNFPDGLSGGPLAMKRKAPIILTDSSKTGAAEEYRKSSGAFNSIILGGPSLISDAAVKKIMGRKIQAP